MNRSSDKRWRDLETERERKTNKCLKEVSWKWRARSVSFQAIDMDRGRKRNDERVQYWRRIFRSWEGSICRHNFTGIACQECRWKVDYCFSIRFVLPSASLLNGQRWRGNFPIKSINCLDVIYRVASDYPVAIIYYLFCTLNTYALTQWEQVWVIGQSFTSDLFWNYL